MNRNSEIPASVAAEARRWVERRDAGMSAIERKEFHAWMAADPSHALALARQDKSGDDCDWSWQVGAVDAVLAGLAQRSAQRRRRRRIAAGAVAAAVLLLAGLPWQTSPPPPTSVDPQVAPTLAIVQPQRQTLPDGSVVELKDGTDIAIDFSGAQRLVSLSRGTAHFQVAKNPERPFVVRAAGVAVRAVGTAFTVNVDAQELSVLVTEGRVAVMDSEAKSTSVLAEIDAGKSVVVSIPTPSFPSSVLRAVLAEEWAETMAWRIPRLEFTGTLLRDVISQVNQHNRAQFVLGDSALAIVRISGVLRADKIESLVEMLEGDFSIRAERAGETITLRKVSTVSKTN